MKNCVLFFFKVDDKRYGMNDINDIIFSMDVIYCKYQIIKINNDNCNDLYKCDIAFLYNIDICNLDTKITIRVNASCDSYSLNYNNDKWNLFKGDMIVNVFNDIGSVVKDILIGHNLLKKTVLVTGCKGGIGKQICRDFKDKEYIVIGTDIIINDHYNYEHLYIQEDLCHKDTCRIIVDKIYKKFGVLDCLVNVAAIQKCGSLWEMNEDNWDSVYICNVKSIFLFVKYGLHLLKKRCGNIINIGSVHSVVTSNQIAAYASSKAAVVGLTKNLAIELAEFGIRVNCISPGAIDTMMLRNGLKRVNVDKNSNELVDDLEKKHLLGKVGRVTDISKMVLYLCENSEFITGSNFIVDGGASIRLSTE